MGDRRGLLAALLLGGLTVAFQCLSQRETIARYDDHVLPGFDANVYVAMVENPALFTVPPWGYRVLTPWLVHLLPASSVTKAFLALTIGALVLAAGLLYLFLRRVGMGPGACLVGVAVYGLTPPVNASLSQVFLTDPLTLVLELLLLLALETGAGIPTLALLTVAGYLNKEIFLFFAPAIFFARRIGQSGRRAAIAAVAIGAALLARGSLRTWICFTDPVIMLPNVDLFWLGVYRILAGWRDWLVPSMLLGLLPLAILGATRPNARGYLSRYGYLLVVTLVLPFAASIYTDDRRLVPFFAEDVPRLLLFAVPLLLPLASIAVDRVWPHVTPLSRPIAGATVAAASGASPALSVRAGIRSIAVSATTVGLILAPAWVGDRYRREDLRGPRDGRLLLALCRESLAFARRLERGRAVRYEIALRRFVPQRTDPHLLERMRWFLREGWGRMPHYSTGPVVMQEREAVFLLPCFEPADLDLDLVLSAPQTTRLAVALNQQDVEEGVVAAEPSVFRIRVPAQTLFRGDNRVRLSDPSRAGVRLHDVVVRRRPLSVP